METLCEWWNRFALLIYRKEQPSTDCKPYIFYSSCKEDASLSNSPELFVILRTVFNRKSKEQLWIVSGDVLQLTSPYACPFGPWEPNGLWAHPVQRQDRRHCFLSACSGGWSLCQQGSSYSILIHNSPWACGRVCKTDRWLASARFPILPLCLPVQVLCHLLCTFWL